jgi:ribonuclease BN (tRNA processing enzyme)
LLPSGTDRERHVSKTHISLRFLGTGGAFSRRYGTTCSLLMLGDAPWLIDCGRQAPDQLNAAGIEWHEIAGQLITHVHGDHTYGMEDFAFSRYFMSKKGVPSIRDGGPRPLLVCHSAVQVELWQSLSASLRYVPVVDAPTSGTLDTYFEPIDPVEAEPPGDNAWARSETFEVGELRVVATETMHVPGKPSTSLAISVDSADGIAWWSGDSTVDAAALQKLEANTSVFFHDCTFIEYPGQVHGMFSDLERLPEQIRRKMVLMHHEDDLEDHRARAEALGFRIGLPGDTYDLVTGTRIA